MQKVGIVGFVGFLLMRTVRLRVQGDSLAEVGI